MQAFLAQLELILSTFPPTLLMLLGAPAGSLCSAIVLAIARDTPAVTPKMLAGQFVVGWLTGAFCVPLLSPFLKAPSYTIAFVGGGIGYWGFTEYRAKKQKEILDKLPQPPKPDTDNVT